MSGNILQQIDDTLDGAREQTCACGCGVALTRASPSLYYASPECQSTALRAGASNPHEVESRDDYSVYSEAFADDDHWAAHQQFDQDLSQAMPGRRPRLPRLDPPAFDAHLVGEVIREQLRLRQQRRQHLERLQLSAQQRLYLSAQIAARNVPALPQLRQRSIDGPLPGHRPPSTIEQWLTFTRRCQACGQSGTPVCAGDDTIDDSLDDIAVARDARVAQYCPHCNCRYAQSVLPYWELRRSVNRFVISVESAGRFNRFHFDRDELSRRPDPGAWVAQRWEQLTADLLDTAAWSANDGSTAPPPAQDDTPGQQWPPEAVWLRQRRITRAQAQPL